MFVHHFHRFLSEKRVDLPLWLSHNTDAGTFLKPSRCISAGYRGRNKIPDWRAVIITVGPYRYPPITPRPRPASTRSCPDFDFPGPHSLQRWNGMDVQELHTATHTCHSRLGINHNIFAYRREGLLPFLPERRRTHGWLPANRLCHRNPVLIFARRQCGVRRHRDSCYIN